ncbi:MAG: hypothetical protein K6G25_10240 [Bacteroidales bacterium]|nr:hypothetical protein [Bacteroidales bacterium]
MKKTLFVAIAFLTMVTMACQNMGKGNNEPASKENEEIIKQRVEQMMQMDADYDADKLLTADMFALQSKAQGVHFWADYCFGFQWNLGVMDACSQKQEVLIEGVKPVDSLHCDVAMRYVDSGCYNDPYTLKLLKEKGEWRIDDVVYKEGGTLRNDCKSFYEEMVNEFSTTAPEEVMEFMSQEEPIEENYTDPDCIFYNNPGAVKEVIQGIKNCHELFKQNPGYTEEYGKQIEAMIKRISTHL